MKYKVGVIMNAADIGGAEYVAYQIIETLVSFDIEVVLLSQTNGLIFDRISKLCKAVHMPHASVNDLLSVFEGCTTILNNNAYAFNPQMTHVVPKLGCKYICTLHGPYLPYLRDLSNYDKYIHEYLSFSPEAGRIMVENGVSQRKIRNYPLPFNPELLIQQTEHTKKYARQLLSIPEDSFVIGMITRVSPEKGVLDAIRVAAEIADHKENVTLLIIGGPLKNKYAEDYFEICQRSARDFGFKFKTIFTGSVSLETVYTYQCAFDVGINCSGSEGQCVALTEMFYAGIPAIFPNFPDTGTAIPFDNNRSDYAIDVRLRNSININTWPLEPEEIDKYVDAILNVQKPKLADWPESIIDSIINTVVYGPAIVTPVYNTKVEWFAEMAESIFNQKFQAWVWIIVDDGSTDQALIAYIDRIHEQDDRIQLIRHNKNKRIAIARNNAIAFIKDRGITTMINCDSDDIFDPDLVGSQYMAILSSSNAAIGIQLKFFGHVSKVTSHLDYIKADTVDSGKIYPYWFINNPGSAIWMIDNNADYKINIINGLEDYHYWILLLKAGGTIHNRPDVLANYRVMGQNSPNHYTDHEKAIRNDELEKIKSQLYENQD